eukprot:363864-Chlamydomonas_euryale.AAC.18
MLNRAQCELGTLRQYASVGKVSTRARKPQSGFGNARVRHDLGLSSSPQVGATGVEDDLKLLWRRAKAYLAVVLHAECSAAGRQTALPGTAR